jgi:hypothetical protein
MGYSREGDVVTVRMTVDNWYELLLMLGVGGSIDANFRRRATELVNDLNQGRPREEWSPYTLPNTAPAGRT